jgi:hypothetical protein
MTVTFYIKGYDKNKWSLVKRGLGKIISFTSYGAWQDVQPKDVKYGELTNSYVLWLSA